MRIVDVCAFFTPHGGGVKTYVERKLRAGAAAGHEIIILAPGERAGTTDFGGGKLLVTVPAPRLPMDRRYRYFDDEAALHRLLDSLQPDFVEASSPWASAAMVGRWQGPAPRALVMHADPLSAYAYRWFGGVASRDTIDRWFEGFWRHLRRLDSQFELVVSASQSLSDRLARGGLRHVVTLPMGVEPGIFSPALRCEALRGALLARCGLGPDALLLLGVGRFSPEKRWPMVIEAAMAADAKPPIALVLIGDGRDRARMARAAAFSPHVQILPAVRDRAKLATVLASADALVHGCEAETFCMVAAEAGASGLPLIVPDCGGAADHHRPGQGLMYRAGDPRDLRRQILAFAGDDPRAHRQRAADHSAVRTMDAHFDALFAAYGDKLPMLRAA